MKKSGCDWKTALDWVLMAKNTMNNVHGFNPYQLVFGQNPNQTSVLIVKPPALEGTSMSKWVGQHISALHEARTAFTEAECSESGEFCAHCFAPQMNTITLEIKCTTKEWTAMNGVVIGQDGGAIFVRHEGTYDDLRSKICQLLWATRQSTPDIVFYTRVLAANIKHVIVQTLCDTNKVVRKLTLKFQSLGEDSSLKLVVFCGSSLGNLPDGGTRAGHLIVLIGEQGRFSPVYWQSIKIRRVVQSTLAEETLALADAVDSAISLSDLYAAHTTGNVRQHVLAILCVTNNPSLSDAIKSTESVAEKRLRLEIRIKHQGTSPG